MRGLAHRVLTETSNGATHRYRYDLGGNVVSKTLPNADAVVYHYDSVGRAYEEEGVSHQGVLYYYLSLCDAVGNLESSFEYTANLPLRTVAMDYDAIDRLTTESVTDSNGTVTSDTHYAYDAANNRTQKEAAGVTTTYSFNSTNELTGWSDTQGKSATYGYDSNGNRLTRSANGATDSYTYDAENRLVGLTKNTTDQPATSPGSYSYQYDYRTRRVSRTESGSTTALVFSGGTSVQEYPSTGSAVPAGSQPSAEYVRGSDWGGGVGGILYTMRGGSASFDHYDRRGDVTSRTDSSGTVTWQASYEAFGTRTQEQGTTQDRQKANTKEEDPTGLLNEGMRYRDLETGTFITRDPAGFVDGPNLYAYVRQNPWTKFDPEGLALTETGVVVWATSSSASSGTALASTSAVGTGVAGGGIATVVAPLALAAGVVVVVVVANEASKNPGIRTSPNSCASAWKPMGQSGGHVELEKGLIMPQHTQEDRDAYGDYLATGDRQKLDDYLGNRASDGKDPSGQSAKEYHGGAHEDMKLPVGDGLESHHMPAKSVSGIDSEKAPAIQMDPNDHKETSSHGSQGLAGQEYRAQIKGFIDAGNMRKAMATEIRDVRDAANKGSGDRTKYNKAMQEMLDYSKDKGYVPPNPKRQ